MIFLRYPVILFLLCFFGLKLSAQTTTIKDTLFFAHEEETTIEDSEGKMLNKIMLKCEVYTSPRIYSRRDSIFKPTKVRVTFRIERNPGLVITDSSSVEEKDTYSQVVYLLFQYYSSKARIEYYASSFSFRSTGPLVKIAENNFESMLSAMSRLKEESEGGTNVEVLKRWNTNTQRDLDQIANKR
jgi:hypothetical protein